MLADVELLSVNRPRIEAFGILDQTGYFGQQYPNPDCPAAISSEQGQERIDFSGI